MYGLLFAVANEALSLFLTHDNILPVLLAAQMAVVLSGALFRQRQDWRLHQAVSDTRGV